LPEISRRNQVCCPNKPELLTLIVSACLAICQAFKSKLNHRDTNANYNCLDDAGQYDLGGLFYRTMHLTILYRGLLSSCNYGCEYCPFAKSAATAGELARDRQALVRFTDWIASQNDWDFSILFTPWGEALIHRWYQQALAQLSYLPNVRKVAIQTNLSGQLDWLKLADANTLAFWVTFHPEWADRQQFLSQCLTLDRLKFKFSVGMVGFTRFKAEIAALRESLPAHIYLWINAVKRELPDLSPGDRDFFTQIDPLYPLNTQYYPAWGQYCRAGSSVISVDGDGTMRRCHFIKQPIGNIYDRNFAESLFDRPCTNQTCHCHIGYVHLDYLNLDQVFGTGILERIPVPSQPR